IHAGPTAAPGKAALTLACDMPSLTPEVVRLVVAHAGEADVVIPRTGDQLETLHASYAKRWLPHNEERLRRGRLKIVGFFDAVHVLELPEASVRSLADPAVVFMNVNTPDELERARALEGRRAQG